MPPPGPMVAGRPRVRDLAIEAGLILYLAIHLSLRQTQGLMVSLFESQGGGAECARTRYFKSTGDESGVSFEGLSPARGPCPSADRQHRTEGLRSTLTKNDVVEPWQVAPLLGQTDVEIGGVTADGAYEGRPTDDAVGLCRNKKNLQTLTTNGSVSPQQVRHQ